MQTNRDKSGGYRLTPKEAASLIQQPGVQEIQPHEGLDLFFKCYQLPNGEVLHLDLDNGSAGVWPSLEWVLDLMHSVASQSPCHMLSGRINFEREFPLHVTELVKSIPQVFKLQVEIDAEESTLFRALNKSIKLMGKQRCWQEPALLTALLAFVGERLHKQVGGQWEMILGSDGCTWEPWIIGRDRRTYCLFHPLYDVLVEGQGNHLAIETIIGMASIPYPEIKARTLK